MTRRSSRASRTDSLVRPMSCSATCRLPSSRCTSARVKRLVSADATRATSATASAWVTDASRTKPLKRGKDVVIANTHPVRVAEDVLAALAQLYPVPAEMVGTYWLFDDRTSAAPATA